MTSRRGNGRPGGTQRKARQADGGSEATRMGPGASGEDKPGDLPSCTVEVNASTLADLKFGKTELADASVQPVVEVTLASGKSDRRWKLEFASKREGKPGAVVSGWPALAAAAGVAVGQFLQFTVVSPSKMTLSVLGRKLSVDEGKDMPSGEALIGQRVVKNFSGRFYSGVVHGYNSATSWYRIGYEDGDEEDVRIAELRSIAVVGTEPVEIPNGRKRAGANTSDAHSTKRGRKVPNVGSEMPQSASAAAEGKETGGAGFERNAQAFYVVTSQTGKSRQHVRLPVGPWILEGTSVVHKLSGDKRYLPDRRLPEGTLNRLAAFVPGWLGVSTSSGEPWTPESPEDKFQACFWDSEMAYRIKIPGIGSVEESAKRYDQVALAYYGPNKADTNFEIDDKMRAAAMLPPGEERGTPGIITSALRILVLEDMISHESVSNSVTPEQWQAWRDRVWNTYSTSAPRNSSVQGLAQELAWLMAQVVDAAIRPSIRGQPMAEFLAACRACTRIGVKTDHYAPDRLSCFNCCTDGARRKGSSTAKHGMHTLHALVRYARDDVLSNAAMDNLSQGGDGQASVAEEEGQRLQQMMAGALKLQGMPITPRGKGRGNSTTAQEPEPELLPSGLRVLVVGAGVSGLKAAVELQRRGAEVTVVEGSGRVGGRICTQLIGLEGNQQPVDMGASFVCGTDRNPPVNPILEYAVDELKLKLVPKFRDGPNANVFYDRNLDVIQESDIAKAKDVYDKIMDELLERGDSAERDTSVASEVQSLLAKEELSQLQSDLIDSLFTDLYAATTDKISLPGAIAEGYDGYHELVRGGYKQVVDALADGVITQKGPRHPVKDLRLNHRVTKIEATSGGVRCHMLCTGLEGPGEQGSVGSEPKATSHDAHAVLVTLPLGVLKKGVVSFDPELPSFKKEAIDALDMGTENRVAMLFDKVFWPEKQHFLRPVTGHYTFMNLHALGVEGVLCAWIRPSAVPILESWSKDAIMADVERMLKGMYKEAYKPPLAYDVTYWASNEFSYGSYSYVPVGASKEDYDRLSWPVSFDKDLDEEQGNSQGAVLDAKTRLFFAGEATHKDDAYTVHGAYLSGKREANRIGQWWTKHHSDIAGLRHES